MPNPVKPLDFASIRSAATLAMLDDSQARLDRAAANLAETVRVQELAAARGYRTGAAKEAA